MKTNIHDVVAAWREASVELDIRVEAPHALTDPCGKTHSFAAYLPDFGGPKGMLVLAANPPVFSANPETIASARSHGFRHSIVNADSYCTFDRAHFIDTLQDWQYFGPAEDMPAWYTGKPWTE